MKRYVYHAAIAAVAFGLWAAPAVAHHSIEGIYDAAKTISATGVLKKIQWQNPHMWFYIDVTDDSGKVTTWEFEGASPNNVSRNGTTRQDFIDNIGKTVTVKAIPARNGSPRGSAAFISFADGRERAVGAARTAEANN